MKKMLRVAFGVVAGVFSPFAYLASANTAPGGARTGFETALNSSGLANGEIGEFLSMVIQWMLYIIGFLSVIMIIFAGIMYVTSSGDTEQVDKAKKTLIYAIVGLVVALLGSILINTVLTWMGA